MNRPPRLDGSGPDGADPGRAFTPPATLPGFVLALARDLAAVADADEVCVFGSHAKGRASRRSDVDLMVVVRRPPGPGLVAELAEVAARLPVSVDIHVHTSAELQVAARDPFSFLGSAMSYAVSAHRRPGATGVLPTLARERAAVVRSSVPERT